MVLPEAREAGKRACTVSREASALPASSPSLQPIAAATAGSVLVAATICTAVTCSTACRERAGCNSSDSTCAICERVRARALRSPLRRRFFRLLARLSWALRSRCRLRRLFCSALSFRLAASASSRLSSLSKRWPCEVKVGEWPRLGKSGDERVSPPFFCCCPFFACFCCCCRCFAFCCFCCCCCCCFCCSLAPCQTCVLLPCT